LKVTGFIWLDDIVEKMHRKHDVLPEEVREVFNNRPKFRFVEKGHRPGENVYFASGQTMSGRYLIIFFVYKKSKQALIISARNMTRSERRQHERK
jgi:uncharacterized DUF497 family protein